MQVLERIKISYQNLKHRKEASANLTDIKQRMVGENKQIYVRLLFKQWMMILILLMEFLFCSNYPGLANHYLLEMNTDSECN